MKKSVSVVVPLYNKENTIIETLDSLTTYFEKKSITYEIIIVENQSTDNSKLIVENYINKLNKNLFIYFSKKGLGYALKEGIRCSNFDIIWFVPADMLFGTSDFEYYYNNNLYPKIAASSRAHEQSNSNRPTNRKVISFVYLFLKKIILKNALKDTQGAFIGKAETLKKVNEYVISNKFFYHNELLLRSIDSGFEVVEIPVSEKVMENNKTTINFKVDIFVFFMDLVTFAVNRRAK